MILPLRQRHRRWSYTLAVLLPVLFVAGLARRSPVPVTSNRAILSAPVKRLVIQPDQPVNGTKP